MFKASVVARFPPPSSSKEPNLAVQGSASLLCSATSSQPMAPDQTAAKLHMLPSAQPEILQESPSLHQSVVPVTASPASSHPPPLLAREPPSAQAINPRLHNLAHLLPVYSHRQQGCYLTIHPGVLHLYVTSQLTLGSLNTLLYSLAHLL